MGLGVRESVTGRKLALDPLGHELQVCGGKGAVYIVNEDKVALRCLGNSAIIASRKSKQNILRQGNVLLLDIDDNFYASGTLSKYEIIALKDAVASESATVTPIELDAVDSMHIEIQEAPFPEELKDIPMSSGKKRPIVIDDDDESSSSDVTILSDQEDESATFPKRPGARRNNRIISESDDENELENERLVKKKSHTEGDSEDDVFLLDLNKTAPNQKDIAKPETANWLSTSDLRRKRNSIAEEKLHKTSKKVRQSKDSGNSKGPLDFRQDESRKRYDVWNEAEEEEDPHEKSHGEVRHILKECENIAQKLRSTILKWSHGQNGGQSDDSVINNHISLASIETSVLNSDEKATSRIVTQDHIPDIGENLILKPYQVVGLNWLFLLCENSLSGVLADEMGLGKTVQTIAFLLLLHSITTRKVEQLQSKACTTAARGPHLIVVPASVLNNWKREFAWIAPTLRVYIYHGAKEHRLQIQESLSSDQFDVLLTTYTYFERDSCQEDRNFLRSFQFGYMILDEGHSIKNSKTSRFKRISMMRSKNRLVLSGTPIQNNLSELLALLSFLMPRMFDCDSDELLLFFDGTEETKCMQIRKILAPFILRREKRLVLSQLVPKKEHVEMVALEGSQRQRYQHLLESVIKQKKEAADRNSKHVALKRKNLSKAEKQLRLLTGPDAYSTTDASSDAAIFTQLRKAANHPILLRHHYGSDSVIKELAYHLHRADAFGNQCTVPMVQKELESYSDYQLHDLCKQYGANNVLKKLQLPIETLLESVKFTYLRQLLPELKEQGHRVLIFSQWTKLLDLLEVLMGYMSYRYLRLDGSTAVDTRQELIDEYNQDHDIFVFLLSTRAGGLGINLTAADTVILHDLDFNPTNDEQACDRCHRIGQTRPVSIYKLVAEGTVDHDIYKLGEAKRQLNHAVLGKLNDEAAAFVSSISRSSGKKRNGTKDIRPDSITVEMMLASALSSYQDH